MFAGISGVLLGSDSTVLVFENTTNEIRAFDLRGRHLATFGRRGRGPGEFVQMMAVHHDGDSTLFVSQGMLGVTELTARGAAIRYRRTFGTGANNGSLCTLGARVFLSVGSDSGVIRELDAERRETNAFGTPFGRFENAAARKMANSWPPRLVCDAVAGAIYAYRFELGLIRRYSAAGALQWEDTLPSFRHALFFQQGNGAAVAFPLSSITSVIPVGVTRLLVQVSAMNYERNRAVRRGMSVQPGVDERVWYVIDAQSGRILSRAPGASDVARLGPSLFAEKLDDPFPMVRLRSGQPVVR